MEHERRKPAPGHRLSGGLAFLKTPTFSISKRGVLVSARIRGSLTFFVSYARFSVVGLTNVVVDYGTLNLLLLLFPTRDHNPQPRLVKRVFEMEY